MPYFGHPDFDFPEAHLADEPFEEPREHSLTDAEIRERARRVAPLMDIIERDRPRFDRFIWLRAHGVPDGQARRMVGIEG